MIIIVSFCLILRRTKILIIKTVDSPRTIPIMRLHHDGRLAQLVEHLPYKEGVISSNLVSPTISLVVINVVIKNDFMIGRLAQLVEHLPYKEGVISSNLVSPTNHKSVVLMSL
ncbi:hypothetical protein XBKQ1_1410001 [Xenorhabdus bovienii str. kraussei Quebec]|uniref:Uncharacterized protein n=2 Tax=Xenorhabdus bovienii TaxID=40576 RepID=A0A077PCA1_XENBV|nr:hypothetical protein XBFFL1_2220026 [Xenorhabdus bovienii str. feltiae Florida]CDH18623.1 hypothetical protein XBKQ1_1410001 [Xenorhabdus bovienii str. kraussei Quebec]CDM89180.1 protein of unknown function [Xenorhabdus bovienii]